MSTPAIALDRTAEPLAPPSLRQRQWLQVLLISARLTRTRIGLGIVGSPGVDVVRVRP